MQSQKNDLVYAIKNSGLEAQAFTYRDLGQSSAEVRYMPSRFSFSVYRAAYASSFSVSYSPAEDVAETMSSNLEWLLVLDEYDSWLESIKREISQPDLWATLSETRLPNLIDEENTPFLAQEQEVIRERLEQIRDYAHRVQPSLQDEPERARQLEAKIDYLVESSKRLGRKDWYGIFVGTIFSIAMTNMTTGNSAKDFIEFAWRVINQVIPALSG